ncbi:MAG: hypothetical protein CMG41_00920 [Candidatus Marinimicrobia bacterium]|nr:hypothetical protein [Candidatus Neomarinimicrobiota bacterium]
MKRVELKQLTNICKVYDLLFTWRKKWRLNWEGVKYCSKRYYSM